MDGLGNQHNEGAISASDTLSMVSDAGNKDRKPLKQQGIEEWMSLSYARLNVPPKSMSSSRQLTHPCIIPPKSILTNKTKMCLDSLCFYDEEYFPHIKFFNG